MTAGGCQWIPACTCGEKGLRVFGYSPGQIDASQRVYYSYSSTPGGESVKAKARRLAPEIVLREGKPAAVILDIEEYQEMLERLEDAEDLRFLKEMRKRPLRFKSLDDFFKEYPASVQGST